MIYNTPSYFNISEIIIYRHILDFKGVIKISLKIKVQNGQNTGLVQFTLLTVKTGNDSVHLGKNIKQKTFRYDRETVIFCTHL